MIGKLPKKKEKQKDIERTFSDFFNLGKWLINVHY